MADYDDPRPSSQPVGSTDQAVLKDNLITLDKVISGYTGQEITNRKGVSIPPLIDSADPDAAVIVASHNSDPDAHPALSEFITNEADRAEAAADAASLSGNVYPDTATGLAGTSDGDYFSVVSTVSENYLDLYLNDSSAAVFQKSYPSSSLVMDLETASNMLTGEDKTAIDLSSGSAYQELEDSNEKALVIGTSTREIATLDTVNDRLNIEGVSSSNIDTGDVSESDNNNYEELITSTKAKVIGDSNHSIVLDTVNGELLSTFKIVDNSQNPKPISLTDDDEPVILDGVDPVYDNVNRLYQGTPSIVKTGDRFWLAWRGDVVHAAEEPGNFFVMGYSDDNCQTVTETHILTYTENDHHHIVDPMLWVHPETGNVWMFWAASGNSQIQDSITGCWCTVLQNPQATSNFFSWSKPNKFRYIGEPRRPISIDGKYIMCIDVWRALATWPPAYPSEAGCTFVEFNPSTKGTVKIGRNTPNYNGGYGGYFETEVIQLSTGALMSMTRGAGSTGYTRSFSYDVGKTWTEQEDYTALGEISASRVWLGRTPSGRIALIYNNDYNRRTLTLCLSEDDCESFPYSVIIEPFDTAQTCSYPVLEFDGDDIYAAYDYGRETTGEIRVAIMKESEILTGTSVPTINTVVGPMGV